MRNFTRPHSEQDNIKFYLRNNKRKMHDLRKALTELETELEKHLHQANELEGILDDDKTIELASYDTPSTAVIHHKALPYSEAFLLQMSKSDPMLLEKLIMQHYLANNKDA